MKMRCSVCNHPTYNLYCSPACKQKAYRARKKQKEIAKSMTMTINEKLIYDEMTKRYRNFAGQFDGMKNDHSLEVAIDFMWAVSQLKEVME